MFLICIVVVSAFFITGFFVARIIGEAKEIGRLEERIEQLNDRLHEKKMQNTAIDLDHV